LEISASLFDIEEASGVSQEKVNRLKSKIVKRYREKIEAHEEMKKKDLRQETKEQAR
jgi:hypothetical protein